MPAVNRALCTPVKARDQQLGGLGSTDPRGVLSLHAQGLSPHSRDSTLLCADSHIGTEIHHMRFPRVQDTFQSQKEQGQATAWCTAAVAKISQ